MRRWAVLLVALADCAPDVPPVLAVSGEVEPAKRDAVLHAADMWSEATRPEYRWRTGGDGWLVVSTLQPLRGCETVGGCVHRSERMIWLRPGMPVAQTFAIGAHELGHALGLGHAGPGIMGVPVTGYVLTEADLTECRRVGVCP